MRLVRRGPRAARGDGVGVQALDVDAALGQQVGESADDARPVVADQIERDDKRLAAGVRVIVGLAGRLSAGYRRAPYAARHRAPVAVETRMSSSLSTRALLAVCCALAAAPAMAQIRYPSNPQTQADCDGPAQQWKAQWHHEQNTASQLISQRNAVKPPPGCFGNDHCRNNYYATMSRFHEAIGKHHAERDRIEREGNALDRACRATARAHEQQAEQQRRMAEEQRRQMEQQQREAQARQQDLQRQQQAAQQAAQQQQQQQQQAQQRQIAAQQQAQQEAYRAQQAEQQRQIAAQQRQAAEQQIANQQRAQQAGLVAAQQQADRIAAQQQLVTQLSAIQRETERAQAQEQQRAAIAATADVARASRQYSGLNSAVNERDAATSVAKTQVELSRQVSAAAGHARREAMDAAINPDGASHARIDAGVDAAKDLNSQINRSRGVTPLATQIANDAYSGIGSVQNRVLGDYDRAMSNIDSLNTPPPSRPAPPSAPAPRPLPPLVSIDDLATPPAAKECPALDVLDNTRAGKAGERRPNGDGVVHECKNGKWERTGLR